MHVAGNTQGAKFIRLSMIKTLEKGILDEHRSELVEVLREVQRDSKRPLLKRFPTRYSPSMLSHLLGQQRDPHSLSHSIRQVHDFYGWMAKRGVNRGCCAGALYRSFGYLRIERSRRDGTKGPGRNVHIEHTVPVRVLEAALAANVARFRSSSDVHRFLMRRSICVAFSYQEEKWLREAGIHSYTNPAFDRSGMEVHQFPFRRYLPLVDHIRDRGDRFGIVNIINGQELNLETFSFDDHESTLRQASQLVICAGPYTLYELEVFAHRSDCDDGIFSAERAATAGAVHGCP
jgi:hypothetical protein